jgi:SRSO17 transposase
LSQRTAYAARENSKPRSAKRGKVYVLGVAANHLFHSWGKKQMVRGSAAKIAQNLPKRAWRRLSAGDGTKGARLHDWAYLELADLDAGEYNSTLTGKWTRGLLIRRNIADGDLAFFSTWCPKETPMKRLVSVEGHRWAIEDSFETAKNELGLDHNETQSWHDLHRHALMTIIAYAFLQHRRLTKARREKKNQRATTSTSLPAVRHAILALIARLPPQRCPHCRKWIGEKPPRE